KKGSCRVKSEENICWVIWWLNGIFFTLWSSRNQFSRLRVNYPEHCRVWVCCLYSQFDGLSGGCCSAKCNCIGVGNSKCRGGAGWYNFSIPFRINCKKSFNYL